MSIRRTKHDKVAAQLHREGVSYSFSSPVAIPTSQPEKKVPSTAKVDAVFGFPIKWVYQDLLRTLLVSGIIIIALVVIAVRLR